MSTLNLSSSHASSYPYFKMSFMVSLLVLLNYFFLLTHTLFILLIHKSFGLRVLNKYIHTYIESGSIYYWQGARINLYFGEKMIEDIRIQLLAIYEVLQTEWKRKQRWSVLTSNHYTEILFAGGLVLYISLNFTKFLT